MTPAERKAIQLAFEYCRFRNESALAKAHVIKHTPTFLYYWYSHLTLCRYVIPMTISLADRTRFCRKIENLAGCRLSWSQCYDVLMDYVNYFKGDDGQNFLIPENKAAVFLWGIKSPASSIFRLTQHVLYERECLRVIVSYV
jgi:hypothetical protein